MSAIEAARQMRATELTAREAASKASLEAYRASLAIEGCMFSLTPADALVLLHAVARTFDFNHQAIPALDALVDVAAARYRAFTNRSEKRTPFAAEPGFPLSPAEAQRMEHEA